MCKVCGAWQAISSYWFCYLQGISTASLYMVKLEQNEVLKWRLLIIVHTFFNLFLCFFSERQQYCIERLYVYCRHNMVWPVFLIFLHDSSNDILKYIHSVILHALQWPICITLYSPLCPWSRYDAQSLHSGDLKNQQLWGLWPHFR